MEKYVKVYPFELVDKIAQGKPVYYLDRHLCDAGCVNGLTASRFCQLVNCHDAEGRYDFWCIEVANG